MVGMVGVITVGDIIIMVGAMTEEVVLMVEDLEEVDLEEVEDVVEGESGQVIVPQVEIDSVSVTADSLVLLPSESDFDALYRTELLPLL